MANTDNVSFDIQQALWTLLNASLTPIKVMANPPGEEKTPYVVIGEDQGVKNCTKDIFAQRILITIHAFSSLNSYKEVKDITAKIQAALRDNPLQFAADSGFVFLNLELEDIRHFIDEDGKTKHGTVEASIEIQKKIA